MVAGLIVTHGNIARSLLEAARSIVGELPHVEAVCLEPDDGADTVLERLHGAIDRIDQGDGVMVLADLPGGTPCNAGMRCLADRHVEVVTGVNLSMVIRLLSIQTRGLSLEEAADELVQYGTRSVQVASAALRGALEEPAG